MSEEHLQDFEYRCLECGKEFVSGTRLHKHDQFCCCECERNDERGRDEEARQRAHDDNYERYR